MIFFNQGSPEDVIDESRMATLVDSLLSAMGGMNRVLLLPPDHTRLHSGAGILTTMIYERLRESAYVEIMPALGTHAPMGDAEINLMFPGIPKEVFRVHDWRRDLANLGEVPAAVIRKLSEGKLEFAINCEVNRHLLEGNWDRIISIGQLVPHEIAGIANHAKNVFVGVGGQDTINKTHFLGAVCGMESAMGRADCPVRSVLKHISHEFARQLPLVYLLTVRARDAEGAIVTRGLFAGDDDECFTSGAQLCRQVNVRLLDKPLDRAVVYLDPATYKSAWLGNKAIYRLRMAMAEGGDLIVLAPGVASFGEDREIDQLIRKYGYRGTDFILDAVKENSDLASNLSAAAHLIHGSSEGRFTVTLCAGGLTQREVEAVGFRFGHSCNLRKYACAANAGEGWHEVDGEPVYCVSDPGMNLWATRSSFSMKRTT